jgi:hypothetical protein
VSEWRNKCLHANIKWLSIALKTLPTYPVNLFATNLWTAVRSHAEVDAVNASQFLRPPALGINIKVIPVVESCTASICVRNFARKTTATNVELQTAKVLAARAVVTIHAPSVAPSRVYRAWNRARGNASTTSVMFHVVR